MAVGLFPAGTGKVKPVLKEGKGGNNKEQWRPSVVDFEEKPITNICSYCTFCCDAFIDCCEKGMRMRIG
jgi:hypothetical protein